MTSANITKYLIKDLSGNIVGKHSQHAYCKTKWEVLEKFQPYENYTIQPYGLDEEEEEWHDQIYNLRDFVGYLRINGNKI